MTNSVETKPPIASLVSIGALSKSLGVTPRALRFYEDRGMVTSRRRLGNARGYDAESVERIVKITSLRAVGLPIQSIITVLALEGDDEAQALALRRALASVLRARQAQVAKLEAMLQAMPAQEPELRCPQTSFGVTRADNLAQFAPQ